MTQRELAMYVNLNEGLERLRGNQKVYLRLLASFPEKNMMAAVTEAVQNGEQENAIRAAHSMKGTAGNLSLTALYEASLALELTLKGVKPHEAVYQHTLSVYEKTMQAIHQTLEMFTVS